MKRCIFLSLLLFVFPSAVFAQDTTGSSGSEDLQKATKQYLLERYEGRSCLLTCRAMSHGPDNTQKPQCTTDERHPGLYQATESAVFDTCGGLGCVAPADVSPGENGVAFGQCGAATSTKDCAGQKVEDGLCGERHKQLSTEPVYPLRFMVTGMASADSGILQSDEVTTDVTTGLLLQGGLHSAKSAPMPDGGRIHYDIPWVYWHLAGFVGRDRVGVDAQLVTRTDWSIISRLGAGALGHRASTSELPDVEYRVGPIVHFEIYYNILAQASWLGWDCDGATVDSVGWSCPTDNHGPAWMAGLVYSVDIWDDFRIEED